uniref:Uncharacterized protein n=1 Tax=Salix viminalis TaxID=40686 RepID=A0A6N2N298_SALVM
MIPNLADNNIIVIIKHTVFKNQQIYIYIHTHTHTTKLESRKSDWKRRNWWNQIYQYLLCHKIDHFTYSLFILTREPNLLAIL